MSDAVLIAGAGPVGLLAASRLVAGGQRVILFEKRDTVNSISRASTFHPPTLAILKDLGFLDDLLPHGLKVETIQFREIDGKCVTLPMHVLQRKTAFPFRFHLEQSLLNQHIFRHLQANPFCEVRLNTMVQDVEQYEDRVKISYSNSKTKRSQTQEGHHLIAADGASSHIRKCLGIYFAGKEYENPVLRIFFKRDLRTILPDLSPVSYLFADQYSCSLLQNREGWRAILRLPQGISKTMAMNRDFQSKELERFLPITDSVFEESHSDLYYSSCKIAEENQVDRVLLMGDAAHVTSTRGGMNMNCGIHDAGAISAALLKSRSQNNPKVLTQCMRERHIVARERLIPRTDKTVSSPKTWFHTTKDLASDPNQLSKYLSESSMLDMV